MKIDIPMHTIVMLIGSKNCGKTTFSNEILLPTLQMTDPKYSYKTKTELLTMFPSYFQEWEEHIVTTLTSLIKFPIATEFVLIETESFDLQQYEVVKRLAKQHAYQVMFIHFDYESEPTNKLSNELSEAVKSEKTAPFQKKAISKVAKEQQSTLITLLRRDFKEAHDKYQVKIKNIETYLSCLLPSNKQYAIIGDTHECVEELKALVKTFKYNIDEDDMIVKTDASEVDSFVLVGDYVDKGGQTKAMVEFLYKNVKWFIFVRGNHEHFVYRWLKGELAKGSVAPATLEKYFTSRLSLQDNEELLTKFYHLIAQSIPFARYLGEKQPVFYVTHAPCKQKYIGKLSLRAIRSQRAFHLDRTIATQSQLLFLAEEQNENYPYYFFGHVMSANVIQLAHTIGIDTGCVAGNKLTGVLFEEDSLVFKTIEAQSYRQKENLPALFATKKS